MLDFGKYTFIVLTSYGLTALVIGGLTLRIFCGRAKWKQK